MASCDRLAICQILYVLLMKRNLVYFTAVTKFTLTLSWACEIRCAKVLWGNLWVKVRDYLHKESGPLPGRD